VLEVEADGMSVRSPVAEELGGQLLAATNHLREKTAPSSCSRYAMVERTADARAHRFDRDALWQLGQGLRLPEVVYTLLVEPESRRLGVWLRAPSQDHRAPVPAITLEWSSLVGAEERG
jgi:hypothetical protein